MANHPRAGDASFSRLLNPSSVAPLLDQLIQLLTTPWLHGHTQHHQEWFVSQRTKRETSGLKTFLMRLTTPRKVIAVKSPYVNTTNRLLNALEVAQNLGISKSSVQRLIKTGQITSIKIGSSRRVSEQSLINYVTKLESEFKQEFREAIS